MSIEAPVPFTAVKSRIKVLSMSLRASSSWVMGDFAYSLHKYVLYTYIYTIYHMYAYRAPGCFF